MKQQQEGFTLAELLVVITIIGILAALVLPSIVGAILKGKMVQCRSHLQELYKNVQTYQSGHQGTPPPAMGGDGASNWAMYLKDNGKGPGSLNNKLFFCPVRGSAPKKEEDRAAQDGDYMYNVSKNGLSPLAAAAEPDTVLAADCISRDGKASSHGDPKKKRINFLLKNNSVQTASKGESLFERGMKAKMVGGINTNNPACPQPSASRGTRQQQSSSTQQNGQSAEGSEPSSN